MKFLADICTTFVFVFVRVTVIKEMWMSSMDLRCTLLALLSARYIYAGMPVKQIDLGPKINII